MQQLTVTQRYQIQVLLEEGLSVKRISEKLSVHRSTIYRELNRNSKDGIYLASQAQTIRLTRYKGQKKKIIGTVAARIRRQLIDDQWSPEQIAGVAKIKGQVQVSHETIYQFIYQDAELGGILFKNLRQQKKKRQKRSNKYKRRGQIPDRISIEKRPQIVDEKVELGHLEGDTVLGKDSSGRIVTLVDKKTMYLQALLLPSGQADITAKAIIHLLKKRKIPWKTLTLDNGKEFTNHKLISQKTGVDIYFCHPYASYERGLNENHNGLLRQYFPKNQTFTNLKQADIDVVVNKLNNRPRKSLGFLSPNQYLANVKKQERKAISVAVLT